MKFKLIALSLCMVTSFQWSKGQNNSQTYTPPTNKHEIRLSISDGLTGGNVDVLGMGLSDAITGTKRTDEKSSLVYGFGYRYNIHRFRIGGDFGFSQTTGKLTLSGEKSPSIKEKEWKMLILPTGEFTYLKKGLIELYGAAGAGISLTRHTENGITSTGKSAVKGSHFNTVFAFQVNPIAIRIGNEKIGGFLEAGLGHKGFVTAGISMKF